MLALSAGSEPSRLWSLWEMLDFDAAKFMDLLKSIIDSERIVEGNLNNWDPKVLGVLHPAVQAIEKHCDEMGLSITKDLAEHILKSRSSADLLTSLVGVRRSMQAELKRKVFFGPAQAYVKYYDSDDLFGDTVFWAFSSAYEDIVEAGNCLALERPTACVMHLMRVLEIGLKSLAAALNVEAQNDWGTYLRKIEAELDSRVKTAGARSEDEQFYAEAALNFDRLRRAWRNPTMHPEKTYSQERAEEILLAVKSFMAHLATKLTESFVR